MKPQEYQFENVNVRPNAAQRALWSRFEEFTAGIAARRQGRRLVVVLMGDLIDGVHHQSRQIVTANLSEQRDLFVDCADYFLQQTGFDSERDRLYVLHGTDIRGTHGSADDANQIGRDLGAVPFLRPDHDRPESEDGEPELTERDKRRGWWGWRELELDIYGQLVQLTHHAPVGKGTRYPLYGNAMRSWVKSHQLLRLASGLRIPRYVVWAHKHTAHQETARLENGRPTGPLTTAVCVPALQGKSHWVRQAIPLAPETDIGGWWATIDQDGKTECELDYVPLDLGVRTERIV